MERFNNNNLKVKLKSPNGIDSTIWATKLGRFGVYSNCVDNNYHL